MTAFRSYSATTAYDEEPNMAKHRTDSLPKTETITRGNQVTEEMLDEFWEEVEGRYLDTNIDWEDVFDRMERHTSYDFGSDWYTPAIRRIKREMKMRKREVTG